MDTSENITRFPHLRAPARAYSTTCVTTSQLASGSPPWNSIVNSSDGLDRARSTAFSAVGTGMSVSVSRIEARLAWQYVHTWLQRSVTTRMWRTGPRKRNDVLRP